MNLILQLKQIYEKSLIAESQSGIQLPKTYYHTYSPGVSVSITKHLDSFDNITFKIMYYITLKLSFGNESFISKKDITEDDKIINRLSILITSDDMSISRATFYRGMKPLIDNGIVIKTGKKNSYLVNPYYFRVLSEKQYNQFKSIMLRSD